MAIELNHEERIRLALLVISVMDEWGLENDQQVTLLGLDDKTRSREINRYRQGQPFPQDDALIERSRHILGIQESLHVIFARNPSMPAFWLTNHNNRHFGAAPLAVMLTEGLPGMQRVWGHLDCTQNWG